MNKNKFIQLAACLSLLGGLAPIQAQELPKKTITMIVGFAPGGAADAAARIIAKKLQENIGQNVVVDNRGGAGGNIAHQYMANADVDGSTILLGSIGPLAIAPHLMKLGYNPLKDLAPLTMGVVFPNVLVVHQGVGVKNLAEYIAKAKAKPGSLDFASTGGGSASHLAGELLNQRAGIEVVHIPYKGGAPALQDMLGGRVSSYFAAPPTAAPHIAAGKLVPIATTGLTRSSFMPNVPTVAESGYPGFESAFCVHPTQVPIINEEFAPSADEVEHARGLAAEFERQVQGGRAAFTYKGRMVDQPVLDQARQLLARHAAVMAREGKG